MTNRYALIDYSLNISLPTSQSGTVESSNIAALKERIGDVPENFSIGGAGENGYEGSFLDSIEVKRKNSVWETKADATGSWVHNKSLDRSGSVSLNISQISDDVIILARICNAYEFIQGSLGGLTLQIETTDNSIVCTCFDCYITKIPDHKYSESADNLNFEFTCGCIMFYPDGKK